MSCLHRLGISAALTLGNKKSVDILVAPMEGGAMTVEVKGVSRHYDWPAGNLPSKDINHHFIALVCFNSDMAEAAMPAPDVWIVPHAKVGQFVKRYGGGRTNILRKKVVEEGEEYRNAWHLIEKK